MNPKGPLMQEHRLIEKVIQLLKEENEQIKYGSRFDSLFIVDVVDFLRIYADRTHHGKEEDILFDALAKKRLQPKDEALMRELVAEHQFARSKTAELAEANRLYLGGHPQALGMVSAAADELVALYPQHIAKEDALFFPAAMSYLSSQEQELMLSAFCAFDRQMIHEKYRAVAQRLEKR
jgi:hemerythrin-like domain-containing protein